MRKLRWGILGTAKIARNWIIPAIQASEANELTAIASRDLEGARRLAHSWDVSSAYGSYEQLLEDPDVDAIYNPLPNHLHVPLSIKALEAGKHVLCEKPVALSAEEAQQLLEAAQRFPELLVMEAFMYRFHPQWKKVRQLVEEGALGDIRAVHAEFAYSKADPENIRNRPEWGGGGLMDIGCYCVSAARLVFQDEPRRISARLQFHPTYGVDVLASALLEFPTGVASLHCATESQPAQSFSALGDRGRVFMRTPFQPPREEPSRIIFSRGDIDDELEFDGDQYLDMFDAFAQAIANREPAPTALQDAVANMRVIDAIFDAAQQGAWVELG